MKRTTEEANKARLALLAKRRRVGLTPAEAAWLDDVTAQVEAEWLRVTSPDPIADGFLRWVREERERGEREAPDPALAERRMTDALRTRVAKALHRRNCHRDWIGLDEAARSEWLADADAAIAAMQEPPKPKEWEVSNAALLAYNSAATYERGMRAAFPHLLRDFVEGMDDETLRYAMHLNLVRGDVVQGRYMLRTLADAEQRRQEGR